MARRRETHEELEKTKRISPYQQMDELMQQRAAQPQADQYEDEYADAYDEMDEAYETYEEYEPLEQEEGSAGFFSTLIGKILLGIIALLLIVLFVLLGLRLFNKPDDAKQLPSANNVPAAAQTTAAASIIFAPTQATDEPTSEPTTAPTAKPEPTATPLPIILTNTPTPSPSPTPTPTPSPSPVPTATPTIEPTEAPSLAKGEVNRDANLRESAASNAKVKQTVQKGESITVHEAILDQSGKIWYGLSVDDIATSGWMRDYVVDLESKIVKPTYTPSPEMTPSADNQDNEKPEITPEPTATPNPDAIGTGKTVKEANVRKVMNGKVLTQLKKGKRVDILSTAMDKEGKIWYEVKPQGSNTVGFTRDYLIDLDSGVELLLPTPTPKPTAAPKEESESEAEEETETQPKEENILDREVIGKAETKKEANVRVKPVSGAKLVRQLSKGVKLMILEKYEDQNGNIWYEVSTESGNTHGFVRDYLLKISEIDKTREAQTYGVVDAEDVESTEVSANSKWKYAGNKKSLVFHELSCDSLSSGSDFLVYFESRDYAVNKGYRPCGNCNP